MQTITHEETLETTGEITSRAPARWAKRLAYAAAGAVAVYAFQALDVPTLFKSALAAIEGLGFWGPLLFIALYVAATIFFLPASVLTLGAGAIFGVGLGSAYVSVASVLGASTAFLIGRYAARDWIGQKVEGNARFAAIDRAVAQEGWKIVGLTRLSPAFPFTLLNYAFGLTRVKFSHYVLASWIGMVPGTVMYVYLGSLGSAVANAGEKSPGQWALLVVGLVATVAVTVYVTRIARRALAGKVEGEEQN